MGISFYPRTFLPPVAALFDSIIRHYEAGKKIPDLYKLFPYIPNLSILFLGFFLHFPTFSGHFYRGFLRYKGLTNHGFGGIMHAAYEGLGI